MGEAKKLADRFREVILNGTWIANTNYRHALEGTSWELATTPVGALNTIGVLTRHIHYYIAGIIKVFEGGDLTISDRYSFDFNPISSQEEWDSVLATLWRDAERFAELTETLTDEALGAVFVDSKYGTYQRNIEGMIEHSYYHLGQLVMLKKIISTTSL